MNDHKTITRRSALLGALASTAALAVPVSAQVLPNSTIKAVADEFAAAYVAEHFATVNARSICRAREAAFKSAAIRVRTNAMPHSVTLGENMTPEMV